MSKSNGENKISAWFKGLKAEFAKVIWPDKQELTRETVAVVLTSVVVGLIIAVIDAVVQYGVDFLVNL